MTIPSERNLETVCAELVEAQNARDAASVALAEAQVHIRHLEAALELVPVGVILADENGRILHGNSPVEEIVGHPVLKSADVNSYGEWISYHEDGRRVESHEYPLSRVLLERLPNCEMDVQYQRGDGSRFWMRIIGKPTIGIEGKPIGASVALIDIDTERQLLATQRLLIEELNHRVKNAFSVVKSIVSLSLGSQGVSPAVSHTIEKRLDAYCLAHSKLIGSEWVRAPVRDVICDIVDRTAFRRVFVEGPDVALPSRVALALSMAMYELLTNALKHGSLSVEDGRVDVQWSTEEGAKGPEITITWTERGGPPVSQSIAEGFGTFLLRDAMEMETGGKVDLSYDRDGFKWRLKASLAIAAEAATQGDAQPKV